MEEQLIETIRARQVEEVAALLRDHPTLDINHRSPVYGMTALDIACCFRQVKVVKLLLAHPAINVNARRDLPCQETSLMLACHLDDKRIATLLLRDPRVDASVADGDGHTTLWWACYRGSPQVVEWLIASGKDLGKWHDFWCVLKLLEFPPPNHRATRENQTKTLVLMRKFMANPMLTRHQVRVRLGFAVSWAAEVFAATIFLCDDLFQLKYARYSTRSASSSAIRFFSIIRRLPMELQMIVCNRVVGLAKDSILSKNSEMAFKLLAARILLPLIPIK